VAAARGRRPIRRDLALNAAPDVQLRLLDLQEHDSALDRLAHRRRTLPELAEIEQADARLAELRDLVVTAETERADIQLVERKIEADIDQVRSRMQRDQQRLDTGSVSSPKELESLQHEVESLKRRQGELEDLELEQMELREEVEKRLTALQSEVDALTSRRTAAEERRDIAFGEIDADAERVRGERSALEADLRSAAAPLVELYEKVRSSTGGVGAAALHRGACQGCRLALPPSDLDRIKKAEPDEVLRCEECRRILVRRPDSGLD
jgi:uncharacterized protein